MLKDNFSILNSNESSLKQDNLLNRTNMEEKEKKKQLFEVIQF